jgi:hypothetical protein
MWYMYVYLLPCVVAVCHFLVTMTTANLSERKPILGNMHRSHLLVAYFTRSLEEILFSELTSRYSLYLLYLYIWNSF